MNKKILSLAPLPVEALSHLLNGAGYDATKVEFIYAHGSDEKSIADMAGDADIIIADYTFNTKITRKIAEAAKRAKLVQNASVGYQHIDIEACRDMGISVSNTAGANTIGVAEHTIAMGMVLLKNFLHAHVSTSEGKWLQMEVGGFELSGKTWGIIGFGSIGKAVAMRLVPFGTRTVYHDINRAGEDAERELKASYASLDEILETSDIISLHCPLTDETRHLVSGEELGKMKGSALLINVARGEVVDEHALADALEKKKIAGAGIDVFSAEPISADNPLLKLKGANIILTPHSAGTTHESRGRILQMALKNIVAVLNGREPDNVVN